MNITSRDGEDERTDTTESAPEAAPAGNRRRLLGGVAGGFALAASGLFLPEWLEETAAREGALGGAKGGRRGKDRKGRTRKRTHGDRKDKRKGRKDERPRGSGPLFRSSALTVVNRTDVPLDCTFYYRIKTGLNDYALPTANGTQTITPSGSYRYDPDRYRVGVLIETNAIAGSDLYVDVRNVSFWFPRGGVTKGTNLDPAGGNVGTVLIPEQDFSAGGRVKKGALVLQRLGDSDRIEWEVTIS